MHVGSIFQRSNLFKFGNQLVYLGHVCAVLRKISFMEKFFHFLRKIFSSLPHRKWLSVECGKVNPFFLLFFEQKHDRKKSFSTFQSFSMEEWPSKRALKIGLIPFQKKSNTNSRNSNDQRNWLRVHARFRNWRLQFQTCALYLEPLTQANRWFSKRLDTLVRKRTTIRLKKKIDQTNHRQ